MIAEVILSLFLTSVLQDTQSEPVVGVNTLPVAKYNPGPAAPTKLNISSVGVDVTAHAAAVMDVDSGTWLFEKDGDKPLAIASLTKLMTAMVLLDQRLMLNEPITLTEADAPAEGKAVFVANETFSRQDLLHAMLVGSVNMSGMALARTTGGVEAFVKAMNLKARSLGLTRTRFFDPTGLDERNVSSAHDIARLLRATLNYPDIRKITENSSVDLTSQNTKKSYHLKSTNLLLDSFLNIKPYRVVTAKTGSLQEAGYCLAMVTAKDGHQVVSVVLGSADHFARFQDVKALTYWAFANHHWPSQQIIQP